MDNVQAQRAHELHTYFASCTSHITDSVGMEVETSFADANAKPISVKASQATFRTLLERGWAMEEQKGALVTKITNVAGDALLYELGRQNIELAARPSTRKHVVAQARTVLAELYAAAGMHGAYPHFSPILETSEDLLVIPDERDAGWLKLDGREALRPLATTSSVQFTITVTPETAIPTLNRLGARIHDFLQDYPQDSIWKTYIRESHAGYRKDRYGGPLQFHDLHDYCEQILRHQVVTPEGLRDIGEVGNLSIPLFLRSVWWYFRLRRCGDQLCIEVRPLPRRSDNDFESQLASVLRVADKV